VAGIMVGLSGPHKRSSKHPLKFEAETNSYGGGEKDGYPPTKMSPVTVNLLNIMGFIIVK